MGVKFKYGDIIEIFAPSDTVSYMNGQPVSELVRYRIEKYDENDPSPDFYKVKLIPVKGGKEWIIEGKKLMEMDYTLRPPIEIRCEHNSRTDYNVQNDKEFDSDIGFKGMANPFSDGPFRRYTFSRPINGRFKK